MGPKIPLVHPWRAGTSSQAPDQRSEQPYGPRAVAYRHHPRRRAGRLAVKLAQSRDEDNRIAAAVGMVPTHECATTHLLIFTHARVHHTELPRLRRAAQLWRRQGHQSLGALPASESLPPAFLRLTGAVTGSGRPDPDVTRSANLHDADAVEVLPCVSCPAIRV